MHKYFFVRESAVFRDMLALPAPNLSDIEGMTDERPIHLPQITRGEFENFLWVFYNPCVRHSSCINWVLFRGTDLPPTCFYFYFLLLF